MMQIHKNPFGVILFTNSTIGGLKFVTNWDIYTSLLKFCNNKSLGKIFGFIFSEYQDKYSKLLLW